MPAKCAICSNPQVAAIDEALRVGESVRSVARQHGVSVAGVGRHRANGHARIAAVLTLRRVPAGMLSRDVGTRAVALGKAASEAVEAAERSGAPTRVLRALRAERGTVRAILRYRTEAVPGSYPASEEDQATADRAWRKAVGAYVRTAPGSYVEPDALVGLRESLVDVMRATPPAGATPVEVVLSFSDGTPVPGPTTTFWTNDPNLRNGGRIELSFAAASPWPGQGDEKEGGSA